VEIEVRLSTIFRLSVVKVESSTPTDREPFPSGPSRVSANSVA
jgi:hypothetical protein